MEISNKSIVAKLLATENVTVVQDNVTTASFDVKNRVLTLPMWADTKDYVKDHLIGHEVAHALYTPLDGWHDSVSSKGIAYKSFLNVVEDARIEKLIQRKYPGLRTTFIKSYKHLLKSGFFGADLDHINRGKLIDRINTYFKCGGSAGVTFIAEERVWLDEITTLETFDDVVELTDRLFGFAKETEEKEKEERAQMEEEDNDESPEPSSGDGESDEESEEFDDQFGEQGKIDDTEEEGEDENSQEGPTDQAGKGQNDPLASDTDQALRNSIDREFNENFDGDVANLNLMNTTSNWKDYVVSYKDILREIRGERLVGDESRLTSYGYDSVKPCQHKPEMVEQVGSIIYKDWRSNNIRSINHMVKEFEMRKSATAYARATVSKTGVIDTVKMNNYRMTDDIFRKVSVIPEGKNHGFIMYLDMSGSMSEYMHQTVGQLLTMVHFTRQVSVPFRVYGFSDAIDHLFEANPTTLDNPANTMLPDHGMRLLELFNENMTKSEMLTMCYGLLTAYVGRQRNEVPLPGISYGDYYDCNVNCLRLGGTPLDAAMTIGIGGARAFRKEKQLDVLNTIFLTDGCSHNMPYITEDDSRKRLRNHLPYPTMRNYVTLSMEGKRHRLRHNRDWTRIIREIYVAATGSRTIGYMITQKGVSRVIREVRNDLFDGFLAAEKESKIRKEFRKDGFYCATDGPLDQQYYIPYTMLENVNQAPEKTVERGAAKGAIRNAFKKGLGNQKQNRKMLTGIVEAVA